LSACRIHAPASSDAPFAAPRWFSGDGGWFCLATTLARDAMMMMMLLLLEKVDDELA